MLFNTKDGILSGEKIKIGRFEFKRINKNEVVGKIIKELYKDWEGGYGGVDLYKLPRELTGWDEQCWTYSAIMMNELGGKNRIIPSFTESKYVIDFEFDYYSYEAQVHMVVDSKGGILKTYIVL